jgi:hypothetical protein
MTFDVGLIAESSRIVAYTFLLTCTDCTVLLEGHFSIHPSGLRGRLYKALFEAAHIGPWRLTRKNPGHFAYNFRLLTRWKEVQLVYDERLE